jgi:hypothetical protein
MWERGKEMTTENKLGFTVQQQDLSKDKKPATGVHNTPEDFTATFGYRSMAETLELSRKQAEAAQAKKEELKRAQETAVCTSLHTKDL